tara:strand:+ start:4753 stop:4875 length:123 start_codon:yes stop_codon:yes gene_type:complete
MLIAALCLFLWETLIKEKYFNLPLKESKREMSEKMRNEIQ